MSSDVITVSSHESIKLTIEPPSSLSARDEEGSSSAIPSALRHDRAQEDAPSLVMANTLEVPTLKSPIDNSPIENSSTSDFSINSSTGALIQEENSSEMIPNKIIETKQEPTDTPLSITETRKIEVTFEGLPTRNAEETEDIAELKKILKKSKYKHMFSRLLLTIAYFIIMFAFGASQSIIGPCLSFLTINVAATSSTIGWIFTLKGLGSIAGTLFGGKILDIIAFQLSNYRGFLYEWKKKRQIIKDPSSTDHLDSEKEMEKIRALPPIKKYIARNYSIHAYFAVCVLVLVGSLAATPFIRDYGLLLFVYFLFGLGSGLTIMEGNVLCAWLWGKYAATALLFNSAIIGLGAFLCPIILNGLIASDSSKNTIATNSTSSSFEEFIENSIMMTFDNSTLNSTSIDNILNGNWRFTYIIIAGILFVSVIVILPIFQVILTKFELFRLHGIVSVDEIDEERWERKIELASKLPKEENIEMKSSPSMLTNEMIPSQSTADFLEKEAQREQEDEAKEEEIRQTMTFGLVISKLVHWYHKLRTYRAFILFSLGFFFSFGIETSIGGLISTYLINYVGTTDVSQASLMVSIYYLSMTIARVISGIFSYFLQKVFKFTQMVVLIISYFGLLTGIIIMLSIPQDSMVGAWIGVIFIGASISTFIPGYIAYPAATGMRDVHLTGFLTSILFVLSSIGEMIIPLIITNSFSWFGFHSFFWIILIVALLMGFILCCILLMSLELRARIYTLLKKKQ